MRGGLGAVRTEKSGTCFLRAAAPTDVQEVAARVRAHSDYSSAQVKAIANPHLLLTLRLLTVPSPLCILSICVFYTPYSVKTYFLNVFYILR